MSDTQFTDLARQIAAGEKTPQLQSYWASRYQEILQKDLFRLSQKTADLLLQSNVKPATPFGDLILCNHLHDNILDETILQNTIESAVRLLDALLDKIDFSSQAKSIVSQYRKIGLGLGDFDQYLEKQTLSRLDCIDYIGNLVSNNVYRASESLAEEKGTCSSWDKIDQQLKPKSFEYWYNIETGDIKNGLEMAEEFDANTVKDSNQHIVPRRNSHLLLYPLDGEWKMWGDRDNPAGVPPVSQNLEPKKEGFNLATIFTNPFGHKDKNKEEEEKISSKEESKEEVTELEDKPDFVSESEPNRTVISSNPANFSSLSSSNAKEEEALPAFIMPDPDPIEEEAFDQSFSLPNSGVSNENVSNVNVIEFPKREEKEDNLNIYNSENTKQESVFAQEEELDKPETNSVNFAPEKQSSEGTDIFDLGKKEEVEKTEEKPQEDQTISKNSESGQNQTEKDPFLAPYLAQKAVTEKEEAEEGVLTWEEPSYEDNQNQEDEQTDFRPRIIVESGESESQPVPVKTFSSVQNIQVEPISETRNEAQEKIEEENPEEKLNSLREEALSPEIAGILINNDNKGNEEISQQIQEIKKEGYAQEAESGQEDEESAVQNQEIEHEDNHFQIGELAQITDDQSPDYQKIYQIIDSQMRADGEMEYQLTGREGLESELWPESSLASVDLHSLLGSINRPQTENQGFSTQGISPVSPVSSTEVLPLAEALILQKDQVLVQTETQELPRLPIAKNQQPEVALQEHLAQEYGLSAEVTDSLGVKITESQDKQPSLLHLGFLTTLVEKQILPENLTWISKNQLPESAYFQPFLQKYEQNQALQEAMKELQALRKEHTELKFANLSLQQQQQKQQSLQEPKSMINSLSSEDSNGENQANSQNFFNNNNFFQINSPYIISMSKYALQLQQLVNTPSHGSVLLGFQYDSKGLKLVSLSGDKIAKDIKHTIDTVLGIVNKALSKGVSAKELAAQMEIEPEDDEVKDLPFNQLLKVVAQGLRQAPEQINKMDTGILAQISDKMVETFTKTIKSDPAMALMQSEDKEESSQEAPSEEKAPEEQENPYAQSAPAKQAQPSQEEMEEAPQAPAKSAPESKDEDARPSFFSGFNRGQ